MKGDNYSNIGGFTKGERNKKVISEALKAYKDATKKANADLKITNPIRLELVLNFSFFYHKELNDTSKAYEMCKKAFDDALANIEDLSEENYKDSTRIMQMMRNNLNILKDELSDDEEDDE